jgi:hypothetical protein
MVSLWLSWTNQPIDLVLTFRCNNFRFVVVGHAGTYAAQYVARNLKITLESTEEWKSYHDNTAKSSLEALEFLAKALVQTYVNLDEQLLEMTQAGIMVSIQHNELCMWG